jgi:lipopolysaccharide transport system ATP-binding protein
MSAGCAAVAAHRVDLACLSMTPIAIRAEGLGKQYQLGKNGTGMFRYKSLRDSIAAGVAAPFRYLRAIGARKPASESGGHDVFWALRDINFEVRQGELVGVIGRNGAGKSTLLKVLARITEPTAGRAEIRGRVGSILEVGTGFHSELTGRENIYLSGAILGMRKAEIARKFDEMVAFAEVERFIDTPVKHFSSGMYLRLAFAVAAHLDPEILFIDEVLAVGDTAFQKKCVGKLDSVAKTGRTVLFVSHNLGALSNICTRAIHLVAGTKYSEGPVGAVIGEYISLNGTGKGERTWDASERTRPGAMFRLAAVRIISGGKASGEVDIDQDVHVEVDIDNLKPGAYLSTSIQLVDQLGSTVLSSANFHSVNLVRDEWFGRPHPTGRYRTVCTIPANCLNEGTFSISVLLLSNVVHIEVFEKEAISFTVHDTGAMKKEWAGEWSGAVRPRLAWSTLSLG